jgi:hypothetical protein
MTIVSSKLGQGKTNINKEKTIEDMGISMPSTYATLDNIQEDYQSHMIEVEGKIDKHPITILIDS